MPKWKKHPNQPRYQEYWIPSVEAYAASGMKVSKAARMLFTDRNTLQYRLEVVKEQTGLSPFVFDDLVQLVGMARNQKEFGIVHLADEDINNIPTTDAYVTIHKLINRLGYKLVLEKK